MRPLRFVQMTRAQRGFTLVELMTVVGIMGILAAVAVTLTRKHVVTAKGNRALAGVQAIRVAEEAFRAEHGQYLDCSPGVLRYYPMLTPGKSEYSWRQPTHQDYGRWAALGLPSEGVSTPYGYMVSAGLPTTGFPVLKTAAKPTLPTFADPWYVIQVEGNLDGDSVFMRGFATSANGEVYIEDESE